MPTRGSQTPPELHAGWVPADDRPDPVALLEEQNADPGAGPGAGPARPDDGLPVHVLPRRGEDHGHRPGRHPDRRVDRAAVRGRAPVQLRGVRLPGTATVVRPQRLRRDPARPVRVRREADGGQLHHRRPEQRADHGRGDVRHRRRRCGPTGRRWPSSRRCAPWTSGTPTCPRTTCGPRSARVAADRQRTKDGKAGKDGKKGEGGQGTPRPARRPARERCGGRPSAPRRPCARRTPGTACRRCPSSANSSTGTTGSSANPRSWCPARDLAAARTA